MRSKGITKNHKNPKYESERCETLKTINLLTQDSLFCCQLRKGEIKLKQRAQSETASGKILT